MKSLAIFLAGQAGDILEASCILHYRDQFFGDRKIVWFIEDCNRDLLKYQDVELRTFPRGFGYPEMVEEENRKLIEQGKEPVWENWEPLVDENNHLNLDLAKGYPSLSEFSFGAFPAPHQMDVEKRVGIQYADVSKKVFGISDNWEWHPVLNFSLEEMEGVEDFINDMPVRYNIALETFAGSGQSLLSGEQVRRSMQICKEVLGECNFIFLSHKYLNGNEAFPQDFLEDEDIYFAKDFTVRECALIVRECDFMISVSSGITVAASCWYNKDNPTDILQYAGSLVCSTRAIALSRFELVTHDDKPLEVAQQEFYDKLKIMLTQLR